MIKQVFTNSRTNTDSDERLFPKGDIRKGVNIRMGVSETGDAGAIENVLGNEQIGALNLGDNPKTIGVDKSSVLNKIYWLVKSDTGCYFIEYELESLTPIIILKDTRPEATRVLRLSTDYHVNRIAIIEDFDNNKVLAIWSDGLNFIACVNVDRAKTYGENNFAEEDISLIKNPPDTMPTMVLSNTVEEIENNIEEKFLRFAYDYKYLDGEHSPFSSFTAVAFKAKKFNYDYSTNTNEGMVNSFNKVELTVNTGSKLVTDLRLVFKESNSDVPYVVETYNKEEEGWGDNVEVTLEFLNNKISQVLPQDQLFRLSDNIPKKANTLELIDNTLVFADYTENYNLERNDVKIIPKLSLDYNSAEIEDLQASESVKSIRDYEAGLAYFDGNKRITSIFTSKDNTTHVKIGDSNKKNTLRVNIDTLAPDFADSYRIFIKQSKYEYDTIVPTLFYNDISFVWIKLENGEQDKINEGDYVIVKSDSTGILDNYVETRVIEVKQQPKNFLEDDTETETKQIAGLYFKIKPSTKYKIDEDDLTNYEFYGYDNTRPAYDNPLRNLSNVIEKASYYGEGALNDLTASGSFTGASDIRYVIEIDSTAGPSDTFKWSDDDGANFTTGVAITGTAQTLSNGVEIAFGNTTGHNTNDNWIVSAKSASDDDLGDDENDYTYGLFKSIASNGNINVDDVIEGGARISLSYNEYNEGNTQINREYTSTRKYDNLEEWWFGDNIADDFDYPIPNRIWFRRGIVGSTGSAEYLTQDPSGDMTMIVKSVASETGHEKKVKVSTGITIRQSAIDILFETKSNILNSDVFYELGETYGIDENGNHLGLDGDTSQNGVGNPAILDLNFFNCFAWGNGFESYKIKDSFNGIAFNIDTRPNTFVDDYRENYRRNGIIYGGRYEQTTNYNGLNEFNASLGNFIDLDDANGAIGYLLNKGRTLIAFQENKITPLGYKKAFIYSQEGTVTTTQTEDVFTIPESYAGEYGISNNPESVAVFGNRVYATDRKRGTPIRLSTDGISEINNLNKDFFKDLFRKYPNAKYEGAYDPYFDEYLLLVTLDSTFKKNKMVFGFAESGYSQENKGWTSFYSYNPEKMIGLNNDLFSFKDGQIWRHNSENVPRNNFYGVQYESSVKTILNDDPSNDKIFKTICLEGTHPWITELKTNLSESTIKTTEYTKKESKFYAYARKNEDGNELHGNAVQGIGNILSVSGDTIAFNSLPNELSIGDLVYQQNGAVSELLGTITDTDEDTIILNTTDAVGTPTDGLFVYLKKNPRIEGGDIRGYYLEVNLTNESTDMVELYAVNCNISRSDLKQN